MATKALTKGSGQRVKNIHRLSRRYNELVRYPHRRRLLKLMAAHVEEITQLVKNNNAHHLIETGDLAVLCFELILEGRADIDEILTKCFGRYERKLRELIRDRKRPSPGRYRP